MTERYEAIVIGTGFGGAITACRLSKKWPGKVLVLERGKRYPMGSFPRSPHDFARNFWNIPDEKRKRPKKMAEQEQHGMFDVRKCEHLDVLVCAGLGGGSLIYANVFLMPPNDVFDGRWPGTCQRSVLMPYYHVAKEVLGSRPIPRNGDPRRRIVRTELFENVAAKNGRKSELVDINVFFGNDFNNPTPIGNQERNRYGAIQTSCVYCAECDVGCNYHAKNTLDLNYLFVAENRYQAVIRTEHLAEEIVPIDAQGNDKPDTDGSSGYRVSYTDLSQPERKTQLALTNRVIVSAGALGSTELLLRSRQNGTLPRLSDQLGASFSGNGDFLSFVMCVESPADPNYGPVITQRTDYNLFENFDRDRAFLLEDASYPNFGAWLAEGAKPGFLRLRAVRHWLQDLWLRWTSGTNTGSIGYALNDLMSDDLSYHSAVLLCMGLDKSTGVMSLDSNHCINVDWPYKDSLALYGAILEAAKDFKRAANAKEVFPLPTWIWPFRRNITVHALGGCILAGSPSKGVTSADRESFGQVFGYKGLYVADGSILPTAVGANPTATISALSEMVAEGITGVAPDANL